MKKSRYKSKKKRSPGPIINYKIRAKEVRLIDEAGQQIGITPLGEAISKAKEKGLELIQVTAKVNPPVCKMMDYGKYLYEQKKKEKQAKQHHAGELKGVRLTFGISDHDLQTRANQAKKFLKKGDKIRIEMKLKGREKAHQDFAKEKIQKFTKIIQEEIPIKIERDIKKQPRGLTMIITKE